MIRRRIGIYGATEETLRLIPLLSANSEVEISRVRDESPDAALERARAIDAALPEMLEPLLTDDADAFGNAREIHTVIDAGRGQRFRDRCPASIERGLQVVSPLTARLLWGYGVAARDRKAELLRALGEVVESVDLTIHSDELFRRMLEIAVGVTGAEGGSLMLLDEDSRELRISVAIGIEPELWPKIRVPLGEGIAGRAAADGNSLLLRGKADHHAFHIVRERLDIESAICVPLIHDARVLGVLNLHHATRADAFSTSDLEFMEQLSALDARIISQAQEHETLRNQAARYTAVRDVRRIISGPDPLLERLRSLCHLVSSRVGHGITNLYLHDPDEGELLLAATSLEGGGFAGEYRVVPGQGIDGQVARSRRPAFLHGEDGALAFVALPLLAGERLMGVLSVQAGSEPPRGRAAEETLIEMAAAAAEGISQADRESRMMIRSTRVSAINETGIRMISATELTEVVRLATSSVAMILEADHAVLRLQDEPSLRYVIRSYYGQADGRQQERLFRLDKQVSVAVIKRRSELLVRDLPTDENFGALAGELRSLITAPLKRDGRVIGTLTVYDKVSSDRFYAGRFNDDDLQIFTRFISYVERAVVNCLSRAGARRYQTVDEQTGLPNADYLAGRIHAEISRSSGKEGSLAIALCRIENLEEINKHSGADHAKRVISKTVESLRSHLREFDVLGRTKEGEFTVLLPEPGLAPGERVFALAKAVADAISKEEALNKPVRIALAFGYAVHPYDGTDREALLSRAAEPRIRMV